MRDRDRRCEEAMRATLNRINDLAENGAAPADRPRRGGAAARMTNPPRRSGNAVTAASPHA
jgi:hypothetical protein